MHNTSPFLHSQREIQPRPRMEIELYQKQLRIGQSRVIQQHFHPLSPPYPAWSTFSSQRHICDVAIDNQRDQIWLATWGGVLCWQRGTGVCVRHTSEHGLIGNATRHIIVDNAGVVWAVGREGTLCSFDPEKQQSWQSYPIAFGWRVRHIAATPTGGVYVVLHTIGEKGMLGSIHAPGDALQLLLEDDLACHNVATLSVDEAGSVWLGNDWGLHCYSDTIQHFNLSEQEDRGKGVHIRVSALAQGTGSTLWVGTNCGIYRFLRDQNIYAPVVSTLYDPVFSLFYSVADSVLWAATGRETGYIAGETWHPLRLPGQTHALSSNMVNGIPRIWAGGSSGLYELKKDGAIFAFDLSSEDTLANAVHCLKADSNHIWVGSAQGLHCYDGASWRTISATSERGQPIQWHVRAFATSHTKKRLWVGTMSAGLRRLQNGVEIPEHSPTMQIVAVTVGSDDLLWVATPERVYWRLSESDSWRDYKVSHGIIQALCYQPASDPADILGGILWIGTSRGLIGYRPALEQWLPVEGELQSLSIYALALDPHTNQLWVGTSVGLFSEGDKADASTWHCYHQKAVEVRALAFSPAPETMLWVGTIEGLEEWSLERRQARYNLATELAQPECITMAHSGLPDNRIMALSVRAVDGECEVWIGTLGGISCYRYPF